MPRNRSGASLIDDALIRADVQEATDRHPRSEVLRYVNQGRTELYDILAEAYGRSYFRSSSPFVITTETDTLVYSTDFPPTFYQLISVRVSDSNGSYSQPLDPLQPQEEPWLQSTSANGWPTHYELRPAALGIYPRHNADLTITMEWIPACTDLADSTSTTNADGFNGWEEYVVEFAARRIFQKDDEGQQAAECVQEMARLKDRITKMAKTRDRFRPRRVQDVRGPRLGGFTGRTR
jgi:hypothetical protein